jgi:hypothetical protein
VKSSVIPVERIERAIYFIRGEKVMLDADLAELYGVATKALVQAVKRNLSRFPADFMFQLSKEELESWRSQLVTSKPSLKKGLRRAPHVFTEQGVAMLSSVLRSDRAIDVNVQIMRAFVRLRELMLTHRDIARKLDELEKRTSRHDREIKAVFDAIRQLIETPAPPRRRIGFRSD